LTLSFLKEFLDKSCGTLSGNVELVDAFKVPLIQYDPIRHMFHMNTKGRSIVGDIKVCDDYLQWMDRSTVMLMDVMCVSWCRINFSCMKTGF